MMKLNLDNDTIEALGQLLQAGLKQVPYKSDNWILLNKLLTEIVDKHQLARLGAEAKQAKQIKRIVKQCIGKGYTNPRKHIVGTSQLASLFKHGEVGLVMDGKKVKYLNLKIKGQGK